MRLKLSEMELPDVVIAALILIGAVGGFIVYEAWSLVIIGALMAMFRGWL
jgi:hypothetical protein